MLSKQYYHSQEQALLLILNINISSNVMQTYRFNNALLIDDNELDLLVHTKLITKLSLAKQIITKYSAVEALEFIRQEIASSHALPEIIFLDINMPLMNGFEFLEQIEKFPSSVWHNTKIIMLSSTMNKKEIKRVSTHPYINNFLYKPLSLQALMQLL